MLTPVFNHNQMRQMNRRTVLDLLRHKGTTSRTEIARTLKCDGTTVTNIVRDLLGRGVVCAVGSRATSKAGRPREMIDLNGDFGLTIGLSFDPRFITGIVVNLRNEIKAQEQVFFDSEVSQKQLLSIVKKLVIHLLSFTEESRLLGIGISTFGLLLPEEKIITQAAHFPALEGLDFNTYFDKMFNIHPTVIDRTVAKCMAEIEMKRRTLGRVSDFILLDIGMGIGCAMVMKGEIVCGAGGYVSEFGHMVFDIEGDMCQCGHKGCLETLASIPSIEKRVAKALRGKPIGFDLIVERYIASDPVIVEAVNEAARWLGVGIANLVNFINPTEIVLSGRLLDLRKPYLDVVCEAVKEFSLRPFYKDLRIVPSSLGVESSATGVTNLLLESFFDDLDANEPPDTLGEG